MRSGSATAASPSPYPDVNALVAFFVEEVSRILVENVVGVYLTGSLSYGDFNYERSDVDITVMVNRPVSADELEALRRCHLRMKVQFPKWASRLECTYTPVGMLSSLQPPKEPRPWYWGGEGRLYDAAQYGNEWITNNYLLYEYGIALRGPEFRQLMGPPSIEEVQKACIRDLFTEWEPKRTEAAWFQNGHYASYFVLNLCRILYTVIRKKVGSKKDAAAWVIRRYSEPWRGLVEAAQAWRYGTELELREPALRFLDFVIQEVSTTRIYCTMQYEIEARRAAPAN